MVKKMESVAQDKRTCGTCLYFNAHGFPCRKDFTDSKRCEDEACGEYQDYKKPTVFHRITASPEVLAEKLVYQLSDGMWVAILVYDGAKFTHRETAIAATVARLKEVDNGK